MDIASYQNGLYNFHANTNQLPVYMNGAIELINQKQHIWSKSEELLLAAFFMENRKQYIKLFMHISKKTRYAIKQKGARLKDELSCIAESLNLPL